MVFKKVVYIWWYISMKLKELLKNGQEKVGKVIEAEDQCEMQMLVFMFITMICFFMSVSHASSMNQWPARGLLCSHNCQEILYLTDFIYSFNFLSYMCSTHTPLWPACIPSGMHCKCLIGFHYVWCLNGRSAKQPQREIFVSDSVNFPSVVQSSRPLVMPVYGLPVCLLSR